MIFPRIKNSTKMTNYDKIVVIMQMIKKNKILVTKIRGGEVLSGKGCI